MLITEERSVDRRQRTQPVHERLAHARGMRMHSPRSPAYDLMTMAAEAFDRETLAQVPAISMFVERNSFQSRLLSALQTYRRIHTALTKSDKVVCLANQSQLDHSQHDISGAITMPTTGSAEEQPSQSKGSQDAASTATGDSGTTVDDTYLNFLFH